MKIKDILIILGIVSMMSLFSNVLGTKVSISRSLPGLLILAAIAFTGMMAARYVPVKIPAAAWVVTLGCVLTVPGVPGAAFINEQVRNIGFVSLCTPILAYAGISIGKDLDAFAKAGWRIVVLSCVVFVGTYLASALIAEAVLRYLGQI